MVIIVNFTPHVHYPTTTRQKFTDNTNYVQESYVKDRFNCLNLYFKVRSDDELLKSHDEPFQALMAL